MQILADWRVRAAAEAQDLVGELARPLARLPDLAQAVGGGAIRRDLVERHLGPPDDRGDDVVEVVRDPAGEGADRLEPPRVAQLRVRPDAILLM